MRITMTPTAQLRLEHYLAEVRRFLQGYASVDCREVERDILEHIETSFEGRAVPVDTTDLDGVLRDLGQPDQWVPADERSLRQKSLATARSGFDHLWNAVRTVFAHLRYGPEDFRLAYCSIVLLAFSAVIGALTEGAGFFLLMPFCFLFARATLAFSESAPTPNLRGQQWLVYPSLLLVYLPVAAALLAWPLFVIGAFVESASFIVRMRELGEPNAYDLGLHVARYPYVAAVSVGALIAFGWYSLLGVCVWWRPGWVRRAFHPFARKLTGRLAGFVALIALAGAAASIAWGIHFLTWPV